MIKLKKKQMDLNNWVGIAAGACTAISLVPQLAKILKEKKAEDISYLMLFFLLIGIGGWIWYGFLKNDYPIIITNMFSFIINTAIIFFSLKYKKQTP